MPQSQYQMGQAGISQLGQIGQQIAVGMAEKRQRDELLRQQVIMRQIELQSRMALQRQQEALYGAQATAEKAQAGHYDAQANKLNQEQQAAGVFGDLVRDYNRVPQNTQADLLPLLLGQVAKLAGQGQQHVPQNMAQILQMRDPRMQQMMATDTKLTGNVPAGATMMDIASGQPMFSSPRVLPQGNVMVPGQGGPNIAQGLPPRSPASNLGQLFGPLVNLRGQGMVSGIPIEPENQTYQASDEAVRALIPFLMHGATNAPQAQVGPSMTQPPQQGQAATPKQKAELANKLAAQNPSLSREQILQMVREQLGN